METFWGDVNVLYLGLWGGYMGYTMVRTHCAEQLRCVHLTEDKLYLIIKKRGRMGGVKGSNDIMVAPQNPFHPR